MIALAPTKSRSTRRNSNVTGDFEVILFNTITGAKEGMQLQ